MTCDSIQDNTIYTSIMINYTKYPRGAEWRKWDLHVHTPASIVQHFGGDTDEVWDRYIRDIENLPSEFKVLGINDYLFIDGYKRLILEKEQNGRLKNIDLLLPVVEFRIDKFAGIDFGNLKRINFHVIFSSENELSYETIQSQFLNTLEQSYCLETGERWTRAITLNSVNELGKKIKSTVPDAEIHRYGSDLSEGFNNLNINEDDIINALDKDCFNGKFLTAVGKTEWGELKWTNSSIATKKTIINKADLIFTSVKSVDDFNSGKQSLKNQGVKDLLLDCSDAHHYSDSPDKDRIGNCFTWIKSDANFEGLKQVVHEPEERIAIEERKPQYKPSYQVIDRIEIDSDLVHNSTILLNQNLNAIIGGRSTGKSVLLTAIAQKLKKSRSIPLDGNHEYLSFVEKDISSKMKVIWSDGSENNEREIEFFQQGYMNKLATKRKDLDSLINDILRQNGKDNILNLFNGFISENRQSLLELINQFFRTRSIIRIKEQKARDTGDKQGILEEIKNLEEEESQIARMSASESEKERYDQIKSALDERKQLQLAFETDSALIKRIKNQPIAKDFIAHEYSSMSDNTMSNVVKLFEDLKAKYENEWIGGINLIEKELDDLAKDNSQEIEVASSDPVYVKVSETYTDSNHLSELQAKIAIENNKLTQINSIAHDLDNLNKQNLETREKIFEIHQKYYDACLSIAGQLCNNQAGLEIIARPKFVEERYREILSSGINLKSNERKDIADFKYVDNESYLSNAKEIFQKLDTEQLTLKGGHSEESFCNAYLSDSFYELEYDLVYEGDSFSRMSDGKKAFVVLKLLLDFSDKTCPILIDQPEDDLDNRAIYQDLVKYLKNKKKTRQIILSTHNPNIVVGADSELVIVANQQGAKSENENGKKFQYVSGSLEHSMPPPKKGSTNQKTTESESDAETTESKPPEKPVLFSQGIRQHVCEILEGGDTAFKLREKKYSIER